MPACRTLIVENYPVLGDLLATRLAQEDDFTVVGVAVSADRALELLVSEEPEMLMLDLGLPSPKEGLRVLREARRIDPELKILGLQRLKHRGNGPPQHDGGGERVRRENRQLG